MMKRMITFLLVLAMLCATVSCSASAAESAPQPAENPAKNAAKEDKEDADAGDEEASGSKSASDDEAASAAEIYVWLSENDGLGYRVPEKAISFMEENPKFFPGSDKNTGAMSDFVDYEADYPHVAKSPDKYADRLMNVYGTITDCREEETDFGTITYLQIVDYNGDAYCMYYLGVLEDAFEDSTGWANVLPFGTITFENMGGYYTKAVIGAACYVSIDSYFDYGYDEYGYDDYNY